MIRWQMASPPTLAHLLVECSVATPSVVVPVEPGLTVPWTGPEEIWMAPYTSISSSGWASVKVPVEAKALELELACPRLSWVVNPDPE